MFFVWSCRTLQQRFVIMMTTETGAHELFKRLNSIGRVGTQVALRAWMKRQKWRYSAVDVYPYEVWVNEHTRTFIEHETGAFAKWLLSSETATMQGVGVVVCTTSHALGMVLFPGRKVVEIFEEQCMCRILTIHCIMHMLPDYDIHLISVKSFVDRSDSVLCKAWALWFIQARLRLPLVTTQPLDALKSACGFSAAPSVIVPFANAVLTTAQALLCDSQPHILAGQSLFPLKYLAGVRGCVWPFGICTVSVSVCASGTDAIMSEVTDTNIVHEMIEATYGEGADGLWRPPTLVTRVIEAAREYWPLFAKAIVVQCFANLSVSYLRQQMQK